VLHGRCRRRGKGRSVLCHALHQLWNLYGNGLSWLFWKDWSLLLELRSMPQTRCVVVVVVVPMLGGSEGDRLQDGADRWDSFSIFCWFIPPLCTISSGRHTHILLFFLLFGLGLVVAFSWCSRSLVLPSPSLYYLYRCPLSSLLLLWPQL
jgi:hypothetical protein